MAGEQQVELLLKELGSLVGIPDLALVEGRCALLIDDRLEVELSFLEGDRLIFAALLGTLPADAPQERYLSMLDANFFWRGTDGATIGVERESRTVVLMDGLPVTGLHVGELEARLGRFVNTAQEWIDRLSSDVTVTGGTAAQAGHATGEMILRV